MGALSNKGGRGQRNRDEIGAALLVLALFAREFRGFATRAPGLTNRHAMQATKNLACRADFFRACEWGFSFAI